MVQLDYEGVGRDAWPVLAQSSGNLFATPEWVESWLAHPGAEHSFELWTCRRPGAVAPFALLPVVRLDGELRFAGFGESDQLGPVCAPEDLADAWDSLTDLPCESFTADDVPAGQPLPVAARVIGRTPAPVVDLRGVGSWDEFLAGRSATFRADLRANTRRLSRLGAVLRVTETPAQLDRDFDSLLTLHHRLWGDRSPSFSGSRRDMHREFADLALDRGWLRLYILELEGAAVAAQLNFRFGGVEWHYQSGRDPARKNESVGSVLQAFAVRSALEDGLAESRLLRGGERWKSRWTDTDPGVVTYSL